MFDLHSLKSVLIYAAIGLGTWVSGTVSGLVAALLQTDSAGNSAWHQNPAIVSAIVTAIGLILVKAFDWHKWYKARREKAADKVAEKAAEHQSLSQQREELYGKELAATMDRRDRVHERELDFEKKRNLALMIEVFQLREEKHRGLNYAHALSIMTALMREQMAGAGMDLSIYTFTPKSYEQIMEGVEEKVSEFRRSLTTGGE